MEIITTTVSEGCAEIAIQDYYEKGYKLITSYVSSYIKCKYEYSSGLEAKQITLIFGK